MAAHRQGARALRSSSFSRARRPHLLACGAAREQGGGGPSLEALKAGAARVCQVRPSCAHPRCSGNALLPQEPRSCPPGASEGSAAGRERRGAQVANGPPCLSRGFSRALVARPARPPDLPPPQTPCKHLPQWFRVTPILQVKNRASKKLRNLLTVTQARVAALGSKRRPLGCLRGSGCDHWLHGLPHVLYRSQREIKHSPALRWRW